MIDYFLNEEIFQRGFQSVASLVWSLPLVVFFLFKKTTLSYAQKATLWFAAGALLLEYVSTDKEITQAISGNTNFPFYHVGTPVLFWLIMRIFTPIFGEGKWKPWYYFTLISFLSIAVINAFYLDGIMNFPNLTIGLYSLTGIVLPIVYMLILLRRLNIARLDRSPLFIAAAGMLIYFSGNFLLWLFLTYFNEDIVVFDAIYRVNGVLTILLNLFFTYAIIIQPMPKTKLSLS